MKKTFDSEFVTYVVSKTPYIDNKGNISYTQTNKVCLSVRQNDIEGIKLKRVSKDYYFINKIFDDHYVVCDVISGQNSDCTEELDNSKLAFKFGIVVLQRNSKGNIIPMAEKFIVPLVYDDMSIGNLKTVIGLVNEHWTYIDINKDSKNYGKQLVPANLEHALPFSVEYEGFAECSVDGVVGYLPRDFESRETLSSSDLLTKEQVKSIMSLSKKIEDSSIAKHTVKVKKLNIRI